MKKDEIIAALKECHHIYCNYSCVVAESGLQFLDSIMFKEFVGIENLSKIEARSSGNYVELSYEYIDATDFKIKAYFLV